jgi:hypothetical protein
MERNENVEIDKRPDISTIIEAHKLNLFFQDLLEEACLENPNNNAECRILIVDEPIYFQISNTLGNSIITMNNLAAFNIRQIKRFMLASDNASFLTLETFSFQELSMAHLTLLINLTNAVNMEMYFNRMSQMFDFKGDSYHVPARRIPVASSYTKNLIELAKYLGYDISQLIKSS